MKKLFAVFLSLQMIVSPVVLAQDLPGAEEGMPATTPASEGKAIPYINMALGMGSGIIGTQILTTCTLGATQPSMLIYSAGSLAYIAKEIFGAKGQSKFVDSEINSVDANDIQMDMLKKQKANEEQNLKMIKGKKTWMMAITTIYTGAMAMAIIETIWSKVPVASKPDGAACGADIPASRKAVLQGIKYAYLSASIYQTGKGVADAIKSGNAMGIAGTAVSAHSTAKMAVNVVSNGKKQMEGFFKVVEASNDVQANTVTRVLSNGIGRSITFGAFAVMSGVIMGDLMKQQKKTEENIEKLDKTIASFKKNSAGNTAIEEGSTGDQGKPGAIKAKDMKSLADGNVPKHCWGKSSSGGNEYSEASCGNSLKMQKVGIDPRFNVPTLSALGNLTTGLGQAVSDGDMAKADVLAGDISNMAARVKEVQENLAKELNDKLIAAGEKPVDLNKSIQDQVAALRADVNAAAAAQGMDVGNSTPSKLASEEKAKDETPEVTKAKAPEVALPTPTMEFSEDASTVDDMSAAKTASLSDSLEEFESTEQDISNKSDVSIFKQVSNRYLLNYTRIFEKKKSLEESNK